MNEITQAAEAMDWQIVKDIGRKCSDDVGDAIRRNMGLVTDQQSAMAVVSYAAVTAIGAASGAFAALTNGPAKLDEAALDEMWTEYLRPMALGKLVTP